MKGERADLDKLEAKYTTPGQQRTIIWQIKEGEWKATLTYLTPKVSYAEGGVVEGEGAAGRGLFTSCSASLMLLLSPIYSTVVKGSTKHRKQQTKTRLLARI